MKEDQSCGSTHCSSMPWRNLFAARSQLRDFADSLHPKPDAEVCSCTADVALSRCRSGHRGFFLHQPFSFLVSSFCSHSFSHAAASSADHVVGDGGVEVNPSPVMYISSHPSSSSLLTFKIEVSSLLGQQYLRRSAGYSWSLRLFLETFGHVLCRPSCRLRPSFPWMLIERKRQVACPWGI